MVQEPECSDFHPSVSNFGPSADPAAFISAFLPERQAVADSGHYRSLHPEVASGNVDVRHLHVEPVDAAFKLGLVLGEVLHDEGHVLNLYVPDSEYFLVALLFLFSPFPESEDALQVVVGRDGVGGGGVCSGGPGGGAGGVVRVADGVAGGAGGIAVRVAFAVWIVCDFGCIAGGGAASWAGGFSVRSAGGDSVCRAVCGCIGGYVCVAGGDSASIAVCGAVGRSYAGLNREIHHSTGDFGRPDYDSAGGGQGARSATCFGSVCCFGSVSACLPVANTVANTVANDAAIPVAAFLPVAANDSAEQAPESE